MGPGLIRIKKIGKSSKNKVLLLYNSPLLGGARGVTSEGERPRTRIVTRGHGGKK